MPMRYVKPKKKFGQHFLTDENIAKKIVDALESSNGAVLEIGPGTGVLTKYMVEDATDLHLIDIDKESIEFLKKEFPTLKNRIIFADFLQKPISDYPDPIRIIGNFPYNISSQIFFHVLDYKDQVPEIVGMLQKEVAERLASPPGNKTYGILSVLLQAYYDIEYLFSVPPDVFNPPPKVNSGVIRLKRNQTKKLNCDEKFFKRVVKQGFQSRRKTLWNALKPLNLPEALREEKVFSLRAEQLSVNDFVDLTNRIQESSENHTI